jgi:prevent-host-death family protein
MEKSKSVATITASTLQREVGNVLRRAAKDGEHIIVERGGFPVVVILPLADYRALMNEHRPVKQHSISEKTDATTK